MVTFKDDARPTHHRVFQHPICFFARAVKIGASLDRSSQQVMETYSREADGVFQDVYAFFSVESPHLLQSFQAWRYVKVVVVTQLVRKGLHALFFENLLAFFELRELQNKVALQL